MRMTLDDSSRLKPADEILNRPLREADGSGNVPTGGVAPAGVPALVAGQVVHEIGDEILVRGEIEFPSDIVEEDRVSRRALAAWGTLCSSSIQLHPLSLRHDQALMKAASGAMTARCAASRWGLRRATLGDMDETKHPTEEPAIESSENADDTLDAYLGLMLRIHEEISADPERYARLKKALTDEKDSVRFD